MAVNERTVEQLADIVGSERVRADRRERKMYSFDIGAMPKLVKPFVPAGIAGAVVRPHSEDEVVRLVKLARRENLKIVPRAWATSGYGGVLPPKDAVVIDMSAMMRVLKVDADSLGYLGADRPRDQEAGAHASALPVFVSELECRRLACPGRIRLRQLRVRHVQGQRGICTRGPSDR
jgi:hypothetical protein